MADLKISELSALAGSDVATGDLVAVVDSSASETKKLTIGDLIANGVQQTCCWLGRPLCRQGCMLVS